MSATARPLVVLGSGGAAREVAQLLRACPDAASVPVAVAGFLDDDPARAGTAVDGVPVLGPTGEAADHAARGALLLACVGKPGAPASRQRLVDRLGLPDEVWATVVHPLASVSPDSTVGAGSVLHAGVVLTAAVTVGRHVYLMPHVVLTHDDDVGDAATSGAGVRLAGGVSVGAAAYLGSGALVREHRRIGAGAVVGMGSVVLRDVPPGQTWAGNPARPLTPSPAALLEASL
ncbi:sugar O-acyltransferase, sialic acid O-acetyltransferase NeuD family [Geodermatophilus saharensis]|uniref:Sugar O-acyltransferase, sialic acid O-acetyltransferase NeuD family n=1 Tax=Geodermatophilus saharensis TaxID=1137994 RepID=A0A239GGN8_9ACTN|nr:acetyltransferase [Geodermatophilus saharensis]SNS67643.1 sugar O-acyltransferase, sialic acid O-acetyltransferase NeuD family [Geodermatophilus saharensis]